MADRLALRLFNPQQAHQALQSAWLWSKPMLMAGHRLQLTVAPETRSTRQNRLLHALFADVAEQAKWMGQARDAVEWKVLFVSGHSVATGQGADMVPGLEGEFVNLRESTAQMSRGRMSSLIEYVMAWCAQHGVELRTALEWMDHETGEIVG